MQGLPIRTTVGILALTLVAATGLSGQSPTPPADPTLAELRAMRADLNERLEANIRVQLLVARLSLQEQRTNTVLRQLSDVQDKMRTHETTKSQMDTMKKMFGDPDLSKADEDESNFLLGTLKTQFELIAKNDAELKQQHSDLTTALAQEQARWAAFNQKLEELERMFEKRR